MSRRLLTEGTAPRRSAFAPVLVPLLPWAAVVLAASHWLGVIETLLLGGPLLVVPLGRRVHQWSDRWHGVILAGAGCGAAAVIVRGTSESSVTLAVILGACWLAIAFAFAVQSSLRWFRIGWTRFRIDELLRAAGPVFLTVGAWWLMEACRRADFMEFAPTLVLLTAVHFHMAGFGACTVALARVNDVGGGDGATSSARLDSARLVSVAGWLILAATPITALGHLFWGGFEFLGSVVMTAGVWTLSLVCWRLSQTSTNPRRWLLRVGAIAPFTSMLLAMQYGLGRVVPIAQIPYDTIALVHGSLNLLGFLGANLLVNRKLGFFRTASS